MAKSIEEVLGKSINTTKELRAEIIRLQESIGGLGTNEEKLNETKEKLVFAQQALNKVTAAGKQATDFAKDSILGMEKEYKNLYNTYKMLTEEQRNSDFGKNMAASLEELSNKLNDTKKEVGNFKDNIGRYSQGVVEAFGQMGVSIGGLAGPLNTIMGLSQGLSKLTDLASKMSDGLTEVGAAAKESSTTLGSMKGTLEGVGNSSASSAKSLLSIKTATQAAAQGVKGLATSMKALIANPVGAIIMAIVIAFKALGAIVEKVKVAIKGNEETQMRLKEAMAAFQPIINAVNNAFDALAKVIVGVIEKGAKVVTWLTSLTKKGKEAADATRDIAKSQNELIKKTREYQELNAKENIEVQRLKNEAAATEDKEEKVRLLTEAREKQAEIDARNLELAEENLRILEEEASLTANDAEMNNKLAAAKIAVANATAAQSANAKELTAQITAANSSLSTHTSGVNKEKEALKELLEEIEENSKTEIQKLTEKYEKEKKLLEKYHKDTTKLTEQYNKNVQAINDAAAKEAEEKAREAREKEAEWRERGNEVFKDYDPVTYLANKTAEASEVFLKYKADFEALTKALEKNGINKFSEDANTLWAKLGEELIPPEAIRNANDAATVLAELALKYKAAKDEEDAWYMSQLTETNSLEANAEAAKAIYEANKMGDDQALERKQKILEAEDLIRKTKLDNLVFELSQLELTDEQKLQLETEYYDTLNEIQEVAHQRQMERMLLQKERWVELYNSSLDFNDSIGDMANGFTTLYKAQLKDGKLSDEQTKKKKKNLETLQKVQTATAIASVIGDTAMGIMGVWSAYAKEKIANAETAAAAGPAAAGVLAALNTKSLISAILQTAGLAATGVGQIAAIRGNHISAMAELKGDDNGGAAATAVEPAQIDSNPYTYTRTLQTEEEEEQLNRPVWVSVSDIESGLNKAEVVDKESTF